MKPRYIAVPYVQTAVAAVTVLAVAAPAKDEACDPNAIECPQVVLVDRFLDGTPERHVDPENYEPARAVLNFTGNAANSAAMSASSSDGEIGGTMGDGAFWILNSRG